MKSCVSTFICFILPFLSTVSSDRVICDVYGTYYTYCNPGYVCCFNDEYCCLGGHTYTIVNDQVEFTPGVIAAIVIGSVVVILILIVILCKVIECNKMPRATTPTQTLHVVSLPAAGDHAHFELTDDGIPDKGDMIASKPPQYTPY